MQTGEVDLNSLQLYREKSEGREGGGGDHGGEVSLSSVYQEREWIRGPVAAAALSVDAQVP